MINIAASIRSASFLLLLTGAISQAGVVAPNDLANVEGNTNNSFPFNLGGANVQGGIRYQQVYAASQFSSFGGPQRITAILFRPDSSYGAAFAFVQPDLQIDLSTTAAAPDALNAALDMNVGSDDTVVYGPGALFLSSAFAGTTAGPKSFDIVIKLTTPFLYNPARGNLLLDVRAEGYGKSTPFDAEGTTGDSTSRTSILYLSPFGPFPLSDTDGLVTAFAFGPATVPEPSPAVLIGSAFVVICAFGVKRRLRAC